MLYQYEIRGTGRLNVRLTENFTAEILLCSANCKNKNSLPRLWKKYGYITKEQYQNIKKFGWLAIDTYYTDIDGNCWGRYNPTVTENHKIDFDALKTISITNIFELLNDTYNCYITECEHGQSPTTTNKTLLQVEHELNAFIENYFKRFSEDFEA